MNSEFDVQKLKKREREAYDTMTEKQKASFEKTWIRQQQLQHKLEKQVAATTSSERKRRNHKLIEIGGYVLSIIPGADQMSNDQIFDILSYAVGTQYVKNKISQTTPDGDPYKITRKSGHDQ